jgi:APA family basic amino acid/polyamine antiporter
MLGIVVLAFRLLFASDFPAHFAASYGAGTLDKIINAANAAGGETSWRWAPSIVAVAYVAQFVPMTYVVMYAGEIKNARRNVKKATYIATGLFIVTLTLMAALLYKAVGYRFMSATAFLQVSDPTHYPFDFPFSVNYAVLLVSKNAPLITIVGLSFFIFAALTSVTVLFSVTRVVFAYSWDRVFPGSLAKVNSRTSTPINAAVAVAVIAEGLLYLVLYTSAFANLVFAAIAYWVMWAGVGVAAMLLPYRRKDLFESTLKSQRKILGFPAVSVAGAVLVLLAALSMPFLFVNGAGVINGAVFWVLVVFYVGGPVLFYAARFIRRRQGVDMDLAYREIPAE